MIALRDAVDSVRHRDGAGQQIQPVPVDEFWHWRRPAIYHGQGAGLPSGARHRRSPFPAQHNAVNRRGAISNSARRSATLRPFACKKGRAHNGKATCRGANQGWRGWIWSGRGEWIGGDSWAGGNHRLRSAGWGSRPVNVMPFPLWPEYANRPSPWRHTSDCGTVRNVLGRLAGLSTCDFRPPDGRLPGCA